MPSKSLPWLRLSLGRLRGLEPDPDPRLDPPADPEHPDAPVVVALALTIGESLMANGAAAEETVAGMLVTAQAYGLQWCEPQATLWVVSLSGRMADDTVPTVEQRVVRRRTTDFTALGRTQQLVQEISDGTVCAVEARERALVLCPAPAAPPAHARLARWGTDALHGGAVGASGSLVADGDLRVVAPSFAAATVAVRLAASLAAYGVLPFYRYAVAALPAALAAVLMNVFGHGHDSPAIVVGGLLALLPALTVIDALQDALCGHYLTAYARLMDALGTAVFTLAIAPRMRVPRRAWALVMLLGVGGFAVYIALRDAGRSRLLSTGCVAVAIGLVGQVLASRQRMSAEKSPTSSRSSREGSRRRRETAVVPCEAMRYQPRSGVSHGVSHSGWIRPGYAAARGSGRGPSAVLLCVSRGTRPRAPGRSRCCPAPHGTWGPRMAGRGPHVRNRAVRVRAHGGADRRWVSRSSPTRRR